MTIVNFFLFALSQNARFNCCIGVNDFLRGCRCGGQMKHLTADEFREIFRVHYPGLCRLLTGILGNQTAAEDIAQDAFLKLFQHPPQHFSNISGWLARVGKNLAFNQIRRENGRVRHESQVGMSGICEPEDTLLQEEEILFTRKVLAGLPPRDRTCLLLRSSGHSYAEIAKILGIRESSVGTILVRARERFRKEYLLLTGSDDNVL
ncbi:ECF RNA polymerase sigma factor SigW [Peptococcaceae bacterium CEB3]|nr:ECF RNA polymerase sigma factor SigW [Peptococcaceae bacterium CEB3]